MRIVIGFDVDGTLETSNGPVRIDRLHELEKQGVDVWIVSPSGASPNKNGRGTRFNEVIFRSQGRLDELNQVKQRYADSEANVGGPVGPYLWLYVSNNLDYDIAKQAGFSYIEASQFV